MDAVKDLQGNVKTFKQHEIIYEGIVAIIFSKVSHMLTKLAIPFSVHEIKEECDAEDNSWRYTLIKIKVEVKEDFNRISDEIISYAYSDIDPNDAPGVLLVLENV